MISRGSSALVIVDLQRYYLEPASSYHRFFSTLSPGSLEYIGRRCGQDVIPAVRELLDLFDSRDLPVFFCKLCSRRKDRSDLHPFFRETCLEGEKLGFPDIYPLYSDPMADITGEIDPPPGSVVLQKGRFSAFTDTDIAEKLEAKGVERIFFTGLATSQCVESTARDATDLGFSCFMVENGLADYSGDIHRASLISSMSMLGNPVLESRQVIDYLTG
jgi:nicotinamidase-related amidase